MSTIIESYKQQSAIAGLLVLLSQFESKLLEYWQDNTTSQIPQITFNVIFRNIESIKKQLKRL